MSAAAKLPPKFPWDHVVPDSAFWEGIDESISHSFVSCFTEADVESMDLDPSLSREEKMRHLRTILAGALATKERAAAPQPLRDVDHRSWRSLEGGIRQIDTALGSGEGEEANARFFYNNGANGQKDMSALLWLSVIYSQSGRFLEAETHAREALSWISSLENLGPNSPQALGCMRLLVTTIWKQGRYPEAEEWIEKCTNAIEALGRGKFAKYQEEEVDELERVVHGLEQERAALGVVKG